MKIPLETRNKISEDLKNNVSIIDIVNKYKISKASVFRIKKDTKFENNDNETINNDTETVNDDTETVNNDTDNNDTETLNNDNETTNNSEDEKETVNNFNIEKFKKELNNTLNSLNEEDNETVKNNVSVVSNNNSVISKKSVIFKKKPEIIKPLNDILDTIKNCNVANDINELKEIRTTIIIIKLYINSFEKDLKNVIGNNKFVFEKKLFQLSLNLLKTILEDIRITINLKSNKSSFLTISLGLLKGIETISNYSGYDVSGLEELLMFDPDFILDLLIIAAETDLSEYLNPRSSAFLKVVKKMYMLNTLNKIKKSISNINENKDLINKIKEILIKK